MDPDPFLTTIADRLDAGTVEDEALDATTAPVRNARRSGSGWLAGQAALGRTTGRSTMTDTRLREWSCDA